MAITIRSGGPTNVADEGWSKPETFDQMVSVIADEIDDTQLEYTLQINRAVTEAIRFCEREPYYFNETREFTFRTVENQEFYSPETPSYVDPDTGVKEDLNFFRRVIRIEAAFCTYGPYPTGIKRKLSWSDPEELEYFTDASAAHGIPDTYSYFDKAVRLYPVPQGGPFQVRLMVEPVKLAPIMSNLTRNQPHPWFDDAGDMIKERAKYLLYKDVLKDNESAMIAKAAFEEERQQLRGETSRRLSTSNTQSVVPTQF